MTEAQRNGLGAHILDNLAFWLAVALIIGPGYAAWATLEILNHYVVLTMPYTPFAVPGR